MAIGRPRNWVAGLNDRQRIAWQFADQSIAVGTEEAARNRVVAHSGQQSVVRLAQRLAVFPARTVIYAKTPWRLADHPLAQKTGHRLAGSTAMLPRGARVTPGSRAGARL